jgi:phospholipase C
MTSDEASTSDGTPTRSKLCNLAGDTPKPPPDGIEALRSKVDQIFVLMLENRSFDHMLGYLSLKPEQGGRGRTDVNGLVGWPRDINTVPVEYGQRVPIQVGIKRLRDGVFVDNPAHGIDQVRKQINGGLMDGFARSFNQVIAGGRNKDAADGEFRRHQDVADIMGYHTAATVPVYDLLAEHFMVCDRWFSSIPGPTWPNRMYINAGHSHGLWGNCYSSPMGPEKYYQQMPTRLIFDCLDEQKVDWAIYRGGVISWMQLFPSFVDRGKVRRPRVRPYSSLAIESDPESHHPADSPVLAGDPADLLADVVFIDPNHNAYTKRPGLNNDDQAPSDITRGQQLVGEVYEVVRRQAERGRKPLLIVTYDEHGGFYDHEPPDKLPMDQWVMATPASDRTEEELKKLRTTPGRCSPGSGYGCRRWWCRPSSMPGRCGAGGSTTSRSPSRSCSGSARAAS